MLNDYIRTKSALIKALNDIGIKVAALTGKWGVGKTHLWGDVKSEINTGLAIHEKSVYISIFGVKTINELKSRIGQNIYFDIPSKYKHPVEEAGKFLSDFIKKWTDYSVTDSALNLALPKLLSNRLVVIDDIERKHASLDIDELLGFLDEYSELHKVKFLLILNDDKLTDKPAWEILHEKVIDIEIKYKPTSIECFDVVFSHDSCKNLQEVRKSIVTLKLNNIRVIERILKTVKYVESVLGEIKTENSAWVASTALLTACHYKALENEPPFEFIRSYNPYLKHLRAEEAKTDSRELDWEELLDDLGFYGADDFEDVIYDFLNTGKLNENRLIEIFRQYHFTEQTEELRNKIHTFYNNYYWNKNFDHDFLSREIGFFADMADQLNPTQVTSLAAVANELGSHNLEEKLLAAWLSHADDRPEYQKINQRELNSISDEIHPLVRGKLQFLQEKHQFTLALPEAVSRIYENGTWGDDELRCIKNSTIEQYCQALNDLDGVELCDFVIQHLKWMKHDIPHDDIKYGVEKFIEASKKILRVNDDGRLRFIMTRAINKYALMAAFQTIPE